MKTAFIDRDGVLNRDRVNYVLKWDEWVWLEGSIQAMARLKGAGWRVVVFTNQSCIGKGIVPASAIEAVNARMVADLTEAGGEPDGIYVCPHAPGDNCDCRKPLPGLLERAAREMDIDLTGAVVVGDAARDLEAGRAAGAGRIWLVRTGKGALTETERPDLADAVFDNLAAAVDHLLAGDGAREG